MFGFIYFISLFTLIFGRNVFLSLYDIVKADQWSDYLYLLVLTFRLPEVCNVLMSENLVQTASVVHLSSADSPNYFSLQSDGGYFQTPERKLFFATRLNYPFIVITLHSNLGLMMAGNCRCTEYFNRIIHSRNMMHLIFFYHKCYFIWMCESW